MSEKKVFVLDDDFTEFFEQMVEASQQEISEDVEDNEDSDE